MAKSRANNEGNIKLRSDGRYEVRVTVDYDKMTGKPKRVSKYVSVICKTERLSEPSASGI